MCRATVEFLGSRPPGSRFLIESSRKGSGWDGTALDRAPVDELEPNGRRLKVVLVLSLQKKVAATSMSKKKNRPAKIV